MPILSWKVYACCKEKGGLLGLVAGKDKWEALANARAMWGIIRVESVYPY